MLHKAFIALGFGLGVWPCVCGTGSWSYGGEALRWHFAKGERLHYRVENTSRSRLGAEDFVQDLVLETTWMVVSVEHETAEVAVTLDSIHFHCSFPSVGMLAEYTSSTGAATGRLREPARKALAELLKPLAGTPIVLRIDARGKLIDIKFPETWTEVFKGQAAFELAGLLGHLISAPGLKGQLLVPIIELPEKLPAAGESWTRGRELEVWNIPETRAALSWTDAYTYQGDEQHGAASLAKLAMTRTETFTVKPRDSEPHTQKRAFQGELLFDRAKGRIIECRLKEERTSGESTVTVVLINKENITNSVQQATAGSHGKVKPSTDPEKPDQTDKPGPGGEVNRVPRLLEPAEGAVLRNRAATWDFKWSEIPGATGYELYVIGSRATIPVIDVKTNKPSYRYQHGGYVIDRNRRGWTWRVRAVVDGQPLPWSKPQTFDVEPLGP